MQGEDEDEATTLSILLPWNSVLPDLKCESESKHCSQSDSKMEILCLEMTRQIKVRLIIDTATQINPVAFRTSSLDRWLKGLRTQKRDKVLKTDT